jgi:hypothetical protein
MRDIREQRGREKGEGKKNKRIMGRMILGMGWENWLVGGGGGGG